MLLIGQPKSASTSLMRSLAQILNITHKNGQNKGRNDKKCPGYVEIQKYHNTTVIRNYDYLKGYIEDRKIVYKEHILPIKKHLDFMNKINKNVVVLLRKPEETIESYKRVFTVLPNLDIDFNKMLKEVQLFYDTYMSLSNKIYLKVTYRDIVLNFTKTMKKIISHYGFKIPENIDKYNLEKRNFTGHGLRRLNDLCD